MLRPALLAAAIAAAFPAHAESDAGLDALRAELQEMKATYEARIQALEARLQAAETSASTPAPKATPEPAPAQSASNAFNPDVSLILQGRYAYLQDSGKRTIAGFLTDGEAETATRGFTLDDSELVLSASIDPYFRGYFNAVFADDSVGVEEAWVQTLSLGQGLTLKAGRFRSGLGYQNEQHPHAWDFATNNLMYQTLFGEGYGNDGLQLKWVAPTELFTELGTEIGRGANFPGSDRNANGVGSYTLYGHVGGDVSASHSWRAGVSYLSARASEREGSLTAVDDDIVTTKFNGDSKAWLADLVWKWAPQGNASERNVKLAAEVFRRNERGTLSCDSGLCSGIGDAYRAVQYGGYVQGVYQFMPRWRTGYRYDLLDAGSPDYGANAVSLARSDAKPSRHSLMLDYSPSEFSRLRLQYTKDRSAPGQDENQWYVQYLYSLGSHGAHTF